MRSHQIAKHNPYFRLQQDILRKQFFSRQEKAKNIHITNRITKFSVPRFYQYCRNEIITCYQQCRRQTKRSEGALAENGGHYKNRLNFLHIKTDILKLLFCIHLRKKRHIRPAAFISSFRMRPVQSLEKFVCRNECDQKRNQGFAKREGLEPKVNVFCTKVI